MTKNQSSMQQPLKGSFSNQDRFNKEENRPLSSKFWNTTKIKYKHNIATKTRTSQQPLRSESEQQQQQQQQEASSTKIQIATATTTPHSNSRQRFLSCDVVVVDISTPQRKEKNHSTMKSRGRAAFETRHYTKQTSKKAPPNATMKSKKATSH